MTNEREATHIYAGNCPDEAQPDARDPECPACRASQRAPAVVGPLAQVAAGIEALDEGHDPLCMAVLRGKDCTCGVDTPDRPNDPHDDLTPGADPTDRAGVAQVAALASHGVPPSDSATTSPAADIERMVAVLLIATLFGLIDWSDK